ncbi:MAG: HAMP domain-containing histidine kinase [Deferribacteres bacterium]|nr:HAMP domain-containing histidine kinase [candidate division KSB1 bacterium]MCB9500579.1 HAMP domain-containing histidine kinase [Deferribacteres bacterium]
MKFSILNKVKRSLFLKLILLFISAYSLMILVQHAFFEFQFSAQHFKQVQRNSINYASYILDTIGVPPDTSIARQLAQKLRIAIHISGPEGFEFSTEAKLVDADAVHIPPYFDNPEIRAGFDKGVAVDIPRGAFRFLLVMEKPGEGFHHAAEVYKFTIIFFALIIIAGIYFILRWQLKPVSELNVAVTEFGKGNLDLKMQTTRFDELGHLIHSFNDMAHNINEMMRTRDRMLLDVSHELRSPLTRVKVALEFLEDEATKQRIATDIGEIEKMITEILETERLKSPYGGLILSEVDICHLIKASCESFANRQPGIRIVECPQSLILNVDEHRVYILLRNILDNALKYSKHDANPVEIAVKQKQDSITITVKDYGKGIPESELPFVFESFFRADPSRSRKSGGYGLGMSMSKKIMEAHGGSIEIDSTENVGTTVYLKFPR